VSKFRNSSYPGYTAQPSVREVTMLVDEAFDIFQKKVDADSWHVRKARHRRDLFGTAFKRLDDVIDVIPSGSLARGTQLDPINDVDLIVTFDSAAHTNWGEDGESAGAALNYIQEQVRLLLGSEASPLRNVVGQMLPRNHVVKCFLDPRFLAEDKDFSGFFAVEVMPALRKDDGALLVPERKKNHWQTVAPELLIAKVRRRQDQWDHFVQTVRVIKFWMRHVKAGAKSLTAEVLALNCLPEPIVGLSRSVALLRFFTAAAPAVMEPINDPAGHCGEIQPDLDRYRLHGLLKEASAVAANAVTWEEDGEHHKAICCWKAIFGEAFPLPPGGCPGLGGGGSAGGSNGGDGPHGDDGPHSGGDGPGSRASGSDPGPGEPGGADDDAFSSPGGPSDPATSGDPVTEGGDDGDHGRGRPAAPVFPPPYPGRPPGPSRPVKDAPQG
jgi:hypothetical protein